MRRLNVGPTVLLSLVLAVMVMGAGCRSTYYSVWEKFGVEKRDILKKRVVAARDEQKTASEQFKDALTRMREMYQMQPGKIGAAYDQLKGEFDDCEARSKAVHERIQAMDTVASDLFAEWEKELEQISTPSLRSESRRKLGETRQRYEALRSSLQNAEKAMDPVLRQFKDYVLYLKHNLNAQTVADLKGEATNIEQDINRLLAQMNAAIAKADEFVKTMP